MSVLVFLEFNNGNLKDTSKQALSYANSIEDNVYGISDSNLDDDILLSLGDFGLSTYIKVPGFFDEKNFLNSIITFIKDFKINFLVFPKSNNFLKVSSNLSIELNFPLVTNVVSVPKVENKIFVKSLIFSGKAVSEIEVNSASCIFILNKNIINISSFKKSIQIKEISYSTNNLYSDKVFSIDKEKIEGDILLNDADIVVSAGRGLKGPENWKMIEELAKKLSAATACSKPVSDAGWRPHHEHVGQTGLKISPNIYIAIGISGAIQHLAGVNSSKIIIVINNDVDAPFFKHADYGIVGDAFDVIPKFINALK